MRFQVSAQYALRILGYMYERNNAMTRTPEMAERLGMSYLYAMKVLGMLKGEGIIRSEQGCYGGYQMARAPEKITVYDVIRATDGEVKIFGEVNEADGQVREYFIGLQDKIIGILQSETIESLFKTKKEVRADSKSPVQKQLLEIGNRL